MTVHTFFSSVHRAFSEIDHMLEHKTNFNKYEMTEIILCIFSDHDNMKLEINYKKKPEKHKHTEAK